MPKKGTVLYYLSLSVCCIRATCSISTPGSHYFRSEAKMAGVDKDDSALLSKCLEFCQALANQGQVINISVAIGPSFSFSLDTRGKVHKDTNAKKKSPSTLRRNAERREEFLKKKQTNPSGRIPLEDDAPVSASDRPQCDQCEYKASSEKGLRQHVRMKHKEQTCATPENLRRQGDLSRSLTSSPLLTGREEKCQNCEGLFSPGHQCGETPVARTCNCSNPNCCGCHHVDACECWKYWKSTEFCDCTDKSDVQCNYQPKVT